MNIIVYYATIVDKVYKLLYKAQNAMQLQTLELPSST